MSMKNTGKAFEKLVQEVYQSFLDYESNRNGYRNINVQHNVRLKGKTGVESQIDVYWEFELAGRTYSTLVEVKDWNSPVKLEQVRNFKSVIDDIPGFPNGIFVSKSGFQSGAKKYAEAHGITLIQLSESSEFIIQMRNVVTYYDSAAFDIDEAWIAEETGREDKVDALVPKKDHEGTELINPKGEKVQLYQMMSIDAIPFYFDCDKVRHKIEKTLEGEWYWVSENGHLPLVKISGYSFECYNLSEYYTLTAKIGDLPHYIISDLTKGKEHIFYPGSKRIEEKRSIRIYNCF